MISVLSTHGPNAKHPGRQVEKIKPSFLKSKTRKHSEANQRTNEVQKCKN